jgi:hypothetical protein
MKPYYIRKEISIAQQDAINSIEVTPDMLKNAQKFSGLGATVCASMIGSYDLVAEMYKVMRATEIAQDEHGTETTSNIKGEYLHVGFTNGANIKLLQETDYGAMYSNTNQNCYIPLYMLKDHLHRIETTGGDLEVLSKVNGQEKA